LIWRQSCCPINNGPVFGIPGTELGNVWERTQLTADWNGLRTDLARHAMSVNGTKRQLPPRDTSAMRHKADNRFRYANVRL
jgi:hypothetical protein